MPSLTINSAVPSISSDRPESGTAAGADSPQRGPRQAGFLEIGLGCALFVAVMLAYAGREMAALVYNAICRGEGVSEEISIRSDYIHVKVGLPSKDISERAFFGPARQMFLHFWVEEHTAYWLLEMPLVALADAESISVGLDSAEPSFCEWAAKKTQFLRWIDSSVTNHQRNAIRASRSGILQIEDYTRALREIGDLQPFDREGSGLRNLAVSQLSVHRFPLPRRDA